MTRLVQLTGVLQLLLAAGSLVIPKTLGWREETAKLRPLTRQVFWTYAGYIWTAHVAFGLLSTLHAPSLLDGSTLATAVTGFIALWWGARLTIQFTAFDREARPPGRIYVLAEIGLVALFVACTSVYATAAWQNAHH